MTKVGLLSDTHGYWDEKYLQYFESCDEIWHAGDIGTLEVAQKAAAFRPFRAVYGNIDGQDLAHGSIRKCSVLRWTAPEVLMKHIGGYPGKYDPSVQGKHHGASAQAVRQRPFAYTEGEVRQDIGHAPYQSGAAGIYGFHKVRTMVRFTIDGGVFKDLEVIELAG